MSYREAGNDRMSVAIECDVCMLRGEHIGTFASVAEWAIANGWGDVEHGHECPRHYADRARREGYIYQAECIQCHARSEPAKHVSDEMFRRWLIHLGWVGHSCPECAHKSSKAAARKAKAHAKRLGPFVLVDIRPADWQGYRTVDVNIEGKWISVRYDNHGDVLYVQGYEGLHDIAVHLAGLALAENRGDKSGAGNEVPWSLSCCRCGAKETVVVPDGTAMERKVVALIRSGWGYLKVRDFPFGDRYRDDLLCRSCLAMQNEEDRWRSAELMSM